VHYVYVLRSLKDGNLYTGYTADLRSRVAAHSVGKVRATRDRRPLHLIYYEAYLLPKDAKAREVFLKSGSGKRYIRKQMSHYFSASKTGGWCRCDSVVAGKQAPHGACEAFDLVAEFLGR
jgi:putative endonuclease